MLGWLYNSFNDFFGFRYIERPKKRGREVEAEHTFSRPSPFKCPRISDSSLEDNDRVKYPWFSSIAQNIVKNGGNHQIKQIAYMQPMKGHSRKAKDKKRRQAEQYAFLSDSRPSTSSPFIVDITEDDEVIDVEGETNEQVHIVPTSPPVYYVNDEDHTLDVGNNNHFNNITERRDKTMKKGAIYKSPIDEFRRRALSPPSKPNGGSGSRESSPEVTFLGEESCTTSNFGINRTLASVSNKDTTFHTAGNNFSGSEAGNSPATSNYKSPVNLAEKALYQSLLESFGMFTTPPETRSPNSRSRSSSICRSNLDYYEAQLQFCKNSLKQLTTKEGEEAVAVDKAGASAVSSTRTSISRSTSSPRIVFESSKYADLSNKYGTDPGDICRRIRNEFKPLRARHNKTAEDLILESDMRKKEREKIQKSREDEIALRMRLEGLILPQVEIEEEEDEFPALTESHLAQVANAWGKGNENEKLVEAFTVTIHRKDIRTLSRLNWLNDEIMLYYYKLIQDRSEKTSGYPKAYSFNTFFYPKIKSGGHAAVKRWTKKVDIFSMDLLLIPVHLGAHWTFAVVDFRKKELKYYDSMGSPNWQLIESLKKYLQDEMLDKKKEKFSFEGWQFYNEEDIPQQMNGSDCGMFSCKFAEYVSRDAKINFTQEHMPYFRKRMVCEILNKKLM